MAQAADEDVPPLAIAALHPADVAIVVAGAEQPGNRAFDQPRAAAVRNPFAAERGTHERGRQHQVAHAAGGEERLRERAAVDDGIRVQAGERGDGLTGVAELAVVVVLEDERPRAARPLDERVAPCHRHHRAGGELV